MERRKAVTAAATASLTLLAGAAGIALNSGIVGASGDGNVGKVSPVNTAANPPTTVYVEDPAAAATPPVTAAPLVEPTNSKPVTTSAASGYQSGNGSEHESDDRHEYEGAADDD
jgi:hypothetical protein